MFKERSISKRLEEAVLAFRVVVLSGACQTGITALLRYLFPKWDFVAFDLVTDIENARADPDLFLDNYPAPVILDEVQYATEVVAALKRRAGRAADRPRRVTENVFALPWGWMIAEDEHDGEMPIT